MRRYDLIELLSDIMEKLTQKYSYDKCEDTKKLIERCNDAQKELFEKEAIQ